MHMNLQIFKNPIEKPIQGKIKITQIQPRFVLKLTIHFKFGMTWTWIGDFLNFNLETDLEKKLK